MQTLVLVRHGATAWNDNGYFQGHKDVPLNERGREQADALGRLLDGQRFDRIFASPLSRAQETARRVAGEPEILPDLIELDRGHWEGHVGEEIRRRWGKLWKAWYEDPAGLAMPGGEAFDDLWERTGRLLATLEETGAESILACGHKGINRVLIARALDLPTEGVWRIPQPQVSRSVLVRDDAGKWSAEILGDVSHLPPDLRSDS